MGNANSLFYFHLGEKEGFLHSIEAEAGKI